MISISLRGQGTRSRQGSNLHASGLEGRPSSSGKRLQEERVRIERTSRRVATGGLPRRITPRTWTRNRRPVVKMVDNRQTSVQESERRESNSLSWVGSPEPNQSATLARESHHRNLRPVLARTGGAHRYLCFGGEVDRARIELASTACKAISLPLTYQPETKPDRRAGHRPRDLRLVKTMLFQTELRDGHGTGGNRTHPHNPYQGSPFNQSCLSRHVPGPIRTDDLQLRKPLHYPTVLREHEGDRRESNPRYWSHNPALYH